jgi:hypothetical protein
MITRIYVLGYGLGYRRGGGRVWARGGRAVTGFIARDFGQKGLHG